MGKAHPFYRFSNASANAGFMPQMEIQSDLLSAFWNEFVDGDFVTDTIGNAIKYLKNEVEGLNSPNNGGKIRLVYPKPYPAITGIQTLIFYVQNDQLLAVDSTQRVTITLNLNNGVVTGSTFAFSGSVSGLSNYDDQLVEMELLVERALEIYYQNGSAIFPIPYSFDRITGIATSSIARAKNWKLDLDTGSVTRYPLPTNPFEPIIIEEFSTLVPSETYTISLIERIISFTITNQTLTASELIALVNGLHLATDYTVTNTSDSSGSIERVSILFTGERSFLLIGRTDGSFWSFQRFFVESSTPTNTFLSSYAIGLSLPYAPLSGNQLYPNGWYDLDLIAFSNGVQNEDDETYQMPLHTGDVLNFNIIPDEANLIGVQSCQIGLFDKNLNFIQQIGTAQLPSCKIDVPFTISISGSTKDAFVAAVNSNSTATTIEAFDINGSSLGDQFTIPYSGPYASVNAYADAVIAFINGVDGYVATYTNASDLIFTIIAEVLDLPITSLILSSYTYEFEGDIQPASCSCATQLQATVTIPDAPDGCYVFGLYDDQYPNQSIFAFSNSLSLDNNENFTQILEFGSAEDAIIEGFEYYNGWLQKIRVPINGGGEKPKIEESIYRNSDGTYQRPSNISDITLDLHTDYIDVDTQKAIFDATRNPIFVLNNENLFVSGDLETATTQDFTTETSFRNLSQMKFQALKQGYQPTNNSCVGC